jgi:hypothetical protein
VELTYFFEGNDGIGDHLCNNASATPFQNIQITPVAAPEVGDSEYVRETPVRRGVVEIEARMAHLDNWHDRVRRP